MNNIDFLENEKKLLYKELKVIIPSTRKDEIIDRILEIEKEILAITFEASLDLPVPVSAST